MIWTKRRKWILWGYDAYINIAPIFEEVKIVASGKAFAIFVLFALNSEININLDIRSRSNTKICAYRQEFNLYSFLLLLYLKRTVTNLDKRYRHDKARLNYLFMECTILVETFSNPCLLFSLSYSLVRLLNPGQLVLISMFKNILKIKHV